MRFHFNFLRRAAPAAASRQVERAYVVSFCLK
jgi:hypothetical protein